MKYQVECKGKYLFQAGTKKSAQRQAREFAEFGPYTNDMFICWTNDKNNDPLKLRFNKDYELVDLSWLY